MSVILIYINTNDKHHKDVTEPLRVHELINLRRTNLDAIRPFFSHPIVCFFDNGKILCYMARCEQIKIYITLRNKHANSV